MLFWNLLFGAGLVNDYKSLIFEKLVFLVFAIPVAVFITPSPPPHRTLPCSYSDRIVETGVTYAYWCHAHDSTRNQTITALFLQHHHTVYGYLGDRDIVSICQKSR